MDNETILKTFEKKADYAKIGWHYQKAVGVVIE